MRDYKKLEKILRKATPGEGSKGGDIMGHTRTGKPIYASANHESHQGFGSQDHKDAMNQHHEVWSKTQSKIQNIRNKKPNWHPPKQIHDFLNHHYTQMQRHQSLASTKMDREQRHKKTMTEPPKRIQGPLPIHTMQNIHKGMNGEQVPLMAAVVIISPDKKRVLLGKRNKDKEWESPGGHSDIGEHPEDVAIRECFEEFNIPLKPEQLEKLPMMYKKDMTPIHCFMAVVKEYQIKNISCEGDPSEEHSKWKWYDLDGKLPDAMEDNRFNIIVHAKMKLAGVIEMSKSFQTMDDMEGMTTVNTADHAAEGQSLQHEQNLIATFMKDYQAGDAPEMIPLDDSVLYLVKVDDGLYSGFVKRHDKDGLLETVANIDKMTIPAMVQFLNAKQIIKDAAPKAEVKSESPEEIIRHLLHQMMPKEDKMVYVSMDGDNIGAKVEQAEARDDESTLMEFSRRINAGQNVFETWARSVGGSIIEAGGDEALAKVPESAKSKVEFFRNQYEQVVGATVTVGVGESISQSTKARELGKLKGKNRTEVFIPLKSDEELKELFKPKDTAQKLKDSGVLELVKALLRKSAPHPIGTKRQWGPNKYIKHIDGWVVADGEHAGKLMGNFEDKPTHADFARYHSKTSLKEDKVEKGLAEKLEDLSKAIKLPIGSVRLWSGQKFIKQGDGHWMPMGNSDNEPPKPTTSPTQRPSAIQQPQEGVISNDANSMAVAQPRDKKLPAGGPSSQATPHKEPKLPHLMPEKNGGGHVQLHSKDLDTALKHGPISIISAGRNPNIPEDKGMTDEQIAKRYKKLEEELKERGFKYTKVRGHYGGQEDSFMVHNADPKEMDELGAKFNQDSVIHTEGGENRLHYTTGEHKGTHHKGSGHVEVPGAKDYYSEIGTIDGKKSKFSLNLDFGRHHKNED